MQPKFSIITVSLNTLNDFKKTFKSIIQQKFKNFEIIVIDGDSTDGTIDEIKKNKNYIKNYIIEKDNGIYDAMNKGINYTNSEWTIFLNSGDTFFNKDVLFNISSLELKNIDIIYGKTAISNLGIQYSDNPLKINKKISLMPFCHQSCFVKTKLLKKKFDLKYKVSSDFNFIFDCINKNKNFFFTNFFISRIKAGGLSDKKRQSVFNENIEILKKNKLTYQANILYLYKAKEYFLSFIKKFLPKKFLIYLLIFKNKKNLL